MNKPTLTLDRAEMLDLVCPFTDAHFRVQFWDTHQENYHGKHRMAYAIFQQNPSLPSCWSLLRKGSKFYPSPLHACDGPDAARDVVAFLLYDWCAEDICADELEVSFTDPNEEGCWLS